MTLNTSTKIVKKYNIIPSLLNSSGLLLFSDPVFNSSFNSIIMLSSVCSSRQADSETKLLNDTKVDRWKISPSSGHIKFMCSRFLVSKNISVWHSSLNAKWIRVMIWMKVKMDVRMGQCFSRTGADSRWSKELQQKNCTVTWSLIYLHLTNTTKSQIFLLILWLILSHCVASMSWNSEQKRVIKRSWTAVYSSSQRTWTFSQGSLKVLNKRSPSNIKRTFNQSYLVFNNLCKNIIYTLNVTCRMIKCNISLMFA